MNGTRLALHDFVYKAGKKAELQFQEMNTYYYISDHLNTAQLLVDEQGTVAWQGHYTPFGEVDVVVNNVDNNTRFPGQYFDQETGLHYNWHRFYDPSTGRYISADPIGLDGGMNLYAYVGGNPVNFVDPTGEVWFVTYPIGVIAVGTIAAAVDWLINYAEPTNDSKCQPKIDHLR